MLEEEVAAAMNKRSGTHGGEIDEDGDPGDGSTTVRDNREDSSAMTSRSEGETEQSEAVGKNISGDSTADGAMFTLSIFLDGVVSRSLSYYAWQVRTPSREYSTTLLR